jgi:hypothetical protein
MRVVGYRPRLALHREEIACVISDALPTSTTILILTGVWNSAGSIVGNNAGGGAKPCACKALHACIGTSPPSSADLPGGLPAPPPAPPSSSPPSLDVPSSLLLAGFVILQVKVP